MQRTRTILALRVGALAASVVVGACSPEQSTAPVAQREHVSLASATATLQFSVDASQTSQISPWVYGVNSYDDNGRMAMVPKWAAGITLGRFGGNRLSAYNWENNASNAGNDWQYSNDAYLGGGNTVGEATRMRIAGNAALGAATLITVPMLGHVAADKNGSTGSGATGLSTRLSTRFVQSVARKGSAFSASPSTTDGTVYQDEFVWWLKQRFPTQAADATRPVFYSLDNEPDIWNSTHSEVRTSLLTYDEYIGKAIEHASATKDVEPAAQIFAPATATYAGMANLGRYPSADPVYGTQFFLDVFLQKMKAAEQQQGRRLLDVLDVHFYEEIYAGGAWIGDDNAVQTDTLIKARMQSTRSLWDPTYNENTWVTQSKGGPVMLIPMLKQKVAQHYPGTKIAITEYWYGRGGDITGGVTQADALGIFGREGVFAASVWTLAKPEAYGGDVNKAYAYINGAFRMYRDYDGAGHTFGDLSLKATNTNSAWTSVFASSFSNDRSKIVLVAINKYNTTQPVDVTVAGASAAYSTADVYTLTGASAMPVRGASISVGAGNSFTYSMPPRSVTTIVLGGPAVAPYPGVSAPPSTPPVATAPAAPSALSASLASGRVSLGWTDNASNETGFSVTRSVNGGAYQALATVGAGVTSAVDAAPVAGSTIAYRVVATNAAGASAAATSNAIVVPAAPPVVTLPAAPSAFSATLASGRVTLAWTDNASNETGFAVTRSVNGGAYQTLTTVGAGVRTAVDAAAPAGSTVAYRVVATNSAGSSAAATSNTVSVPAAQPTVPAAASGVTAAYASGRVTIRWTDNASNETAYRVLRQVNGGGYQVVATLGAGAVSAVDAAPVAGATIRYSVQAQGAAGSAAIAFAAPVAITAGGTTPPPATAAPAAPGAVAASVASGRVTVRWADNATNETSYRVLRQVNGGGYQEVVVTAAGAVSAADAAPVRGASIRYSVQARNASGASALVFAAAITVP